MTQGTILHGKVGVGLGSVIVAMAGAGAFGAPPAEPSAVAELRPVNETVQVGKPVWVDFFVHNPTDQPVKLKVPGTKAGENDTSAMGLPLSHVFSAKDFRAVEITSLNGALYETSVSVPPSGAVPVISLAPGGSVGRRINLIEHYRALARPGVYRLQWTPYGGALASRTIRLTVTALKQAVLSTDHGRMTIRFDYDRAPNHVANFIELAGRGFYDTTLIHRVLPGILIQGGDPRGDGTGVRIDGKKLKAELSDLTFERGTVAMARKPEDLDSASCQFFIGLDRIGEFDGRFTVFGTLVGPESFETLGRLGQARTDYRDRPIEPLYIRAVTIETVRVEPLAFKPKPAPNVKPKANRFGVTTQPVPRAPVIAIKTERPTAQTPDPTVAPDEE